MGGRRAPTSAAVPERLRLPDAIPSLAPQPVPSAGADRRPARPIGPSRVLACLPARARLGGQLSRDLPRQSGHPAIGDRGGSGQAPRHTPTWPLLTSRPSR
jgi:hypothetical protein